MMIMPGEMEREIRKLKDDIKSLRNTFTLELEACLECITKLRDEVSKIKEQNGQANTQDREGPQKGNKGHKKAPKDG